MNEYASALEKMKAVNQLIAEHPELSKRLVSGEWNFLQWRQAKIFISFSTRERSKQRPHKAYSLISSLKNALTGLVACALTAWAVFVRGKKDVLIFSVDKVSAENDHDFRLDGIYRFVRNKNISFTEVFHTQTGRTLFSFAKKRMRTAVYHEALLFLASLRFAWMFRERSALRRLTRSLSCEEFEASERAFVRTMIGNMLREAVTSKFVIGWYRSVLRRIRPKVILAIDDTRYYQELAASARSEGLPMYALQHGHYTKYHAGWLSSGIQGGQDARPTALYVWNSYWKNELLRLGTNFAAEEIRIGGNPKGDMTSPATKPCLPRINRERLGVLVPFETEAPFEEVRAILSRLLDTNRIKIFFKTRSDWDVQKQVDLYGLHGTATNQVEVLSDYASRLDEIHAVAGIYSTFLYDALSLLRPVLIFKTSMDFGEGLITNDLATPFDVSGGALADRLIATCNKEVFKCAERLERYQKDAGSLHETLRALIE